MKWRTLESGMRRTLLCILAATVAATLVTYLLAGVAFLLLEDRYIQPANYSEQKVADVEALVNERGMVLLEADAAPFLDAAVGDSGLRYQVVDAEGRTLYGTYQPDNVELDRQMLLSESNTAHGEGDSYVHTVPIFDGNGTFAGAIRCAYDFELRFTRTQAVAKLAGVFFVLALASPLLWLGLFSWRFSRAFAASIRTPLGLLRGAAEKIQAQDLDFTIDYRADNELADLCAAFEEMKDGLSHSLTRQWQLEQQRRAMVAALAHDLKTPLSVIKAYSESLADDTPLNAEQRASLDVIAANVDRSAALIQRIQDVSLLERDGGAISRLPLELRPFLAARLEEIQVRARLQAVDVTGTVDAALAPVYLLDSERLTRILDNLTANSLAAMPDGGRLDLSVAEREGALCFSVRDSGPGFSAQDLRHATEQFYRGDAARGSRGGHAGLGLFIVQTLAAQMGGRVTLANNDTGGACVRVCLPAETACEPAAEGV